MAAVAAAAQSKPISSPGPISILDTDAAKLYTHIHPILLLSVYAYKFKAIVADPVPALTNTLIWLLALQVAYAAMCLPPMGGGTATAPTEKKKPGEKKKRTGTVKFESVWPKVLVRLFHA
jgi:phosphatidylinositol glycan class F